VFGFHFMARLTDSLLPHPRVCPLYVASFPVAALVDASDARLHGGNRNGNTLAFRLKLKKMKRLAASTVSIRQALDC
jgi:hypothetical protein